MGLQLRIGKRFPAVEVKKYAREKDDMKWWDGRIARLRFASTSSAMSRDVYLRPKVVREGFWRIQRPGAVSQFGGPGAPETTECLDIQPTSETGRLESNPANVNFIDMVPSGTSDSRIRNF